MRTGSRSSREPSLPLDLGFDAGDLPEGERIRVVVDVRTIEVPQPLTYLVPTEWRQELVFGSTVLVPLRGVEQVGFVVGFEGDPIREGRPPEPPPSSLRSIASVLDPEPAFERSLYSLVEWVSERTHASLAEALHCIAPESQVLTVRATLRLRPAWAAGAEEQTPGWGRAVRSVAGRVREALVEAGGAVELETLRRRLPEELLPAVLRRLRRLGWIEETRSVSAPRVKAKRVKAVRLAPPPATPTSERLTPKQKAIVDYLATLPPERTPIPQQTLFTEVGASDASLRALITRGLVVAESLAVSRLTGAAGLRAPPPPLVPDQTPVVDRIVGAVREGVARRFLLFGVTGSGKTEVYLRACEAAVGEGRRALYLVPEISLTAQVIEQVRARFGSRVGLIHSRLSDGERFDEWQRIRRGEVSVVLGPRSALFAPLPELGLIVLDEEHDSSYKQEGPPRYLARDVAEQRAALTGAVLVAGSATPAIESYYRAEQGDGELLTLPRRVFGRPLPEVEVVDLRAETRARPGLIFGERLEEGIRESLARGEQVILYLNRRGFSTFILCRDCGYVARCPNCNVSLTLHQDLGQRLLCHHCAYARRAPKSCPRCSGTRIRNFGLGTERVEAAAREAFPEARIARLDRDATTRKDSHQRIVKQFREREADLLIGTQMVAKGFDFPDVTLVGVVTADTALNLPDFRAAERSFQLLSQVSGRSGRGERGGKVIVQTFAPEHYSIQAAAAHDYLGFYRQEIVHRRELNYPPFSTLARLVMSDPSEEAANGKIHAAYLAVVDAATEVGVQLLGPCAAPLSRVNRRYRWHLLLKAGDRAVLQALLAAHLPNIRRQTGAGLTVDVDPQSLL